METNDAVAPSSNAEFELWVRPHLRLLRRLAATHVPAPDRDDLVQETLARAWAKRASYDPDRGSPSTWLLALMFDQARRARRSRRGPLLLETGEETGSEPSASLLDLRHAINRLPLRQRQAVLLFYYVDLPVGEIAKLLNCSPGTTKSNLHDARKRLQTELRDHEH